MKKLILLSIVCLLTCYAAKSQTLIAGEYFIDSDPGLGNATSVSFTSDDTLNGIQFTVDSSAISIGYHFIYFRLKDNDGNWSHNRKQRFYVYENSSIVINPFATQLITGEFFIDTDPGLGAGNPITFAQSDSISLDSLEVNEPDLAFGYHFFYLRIKDDDGNWGHCRRLRFYIYDNSPIVHNDSVVLVQAEYWVDSLTIPGTGNLISVIPDDTIYYNDLILGLVLDTGTHIVSVSVKDSNGNWSFPKTDTVRTEFYDLFINVVNRPFTRPGAKEKYEITIGNRLNKDLYDIFLEIKVHHADSFTIAGLQESIGGINIKNTPIETVMNGDTIIPIWIYSFPGHSQKTFNLYLTSAASGNHEIIQNSFEIWHDETIYENAFAIHGDTINLSQSTIFKIIDRFYKENSDSSSIFILPDSVFTKALKDTLAFYNFSYQPLPLSCILKFILQTILQTNISDSIITDGESQIYNNFKELSYDDLLDSSLDQSMRLPCQGSSNCGSCPGDNCISSFSYPTISSNGMRITQDFCVRRCWLNSNGEPDERPHEGWDISMPDNQRGIGIDDVDPNSDNDSHWNNCESPVYSIYDGIVRKVGLASAGGYCVVIEHCNNTFTTWYGYSAQTVPLIPR